MKIEVEISEDDLRAAIEDKVKRIITEQTLSRMTDAYVRAQVVRQWNAAVDSLVAEQPFDLEALRGKIAGEVQMKINQTLAKQIRKALRKSLMEEQVLVSVATQPPP